MTVNERLLSLNIHTRRRCKYVLFKKEDPNHTHTQNPLEYFRFFFGTQTIISSLSLFFYAERELKADKQKNIVCLTFVRHHMNFS